LPHRISENARPEIERIGVIVSSVIHFRPVLMIKIKECIVGCYRSFAFALVWKTKKCLWVIQWKWDKRGMRSLIVHHTIVARQFSIWEIVVYWRFLVSIVAIPMHTYIQVFILQRHWFIIHYVDILLVHLSAITLYACTHARKHEEIKRTFNILLWAFPQHSNLHLYVY